VVHHHLDWSYIKLTPDPYFGQPGQYATVANVVPEHSLELKQVVPNGANASWVFVLRAEKPELKAHESDVV
jgi:hypothetical protein